MMRSEPKPFVIPVFLPHRGCPHQCVFCDQTMITGLDGQPEFDSPGHDVIEATVKQFIGYNRQGRKPVQLSFYGGNFLGIPEMDIIRLLNKAESFVQSGVIDSIRFSTRPDTITRPVMDRLMDYSVKTIELGIQSLDDEVLGLSGRGHTAAQCEAALDLIREYPVQTGVQMMIGLPGDQGPQSLVTAARLATVRPDFVRIYPTIVLAGTPLARLYNTGAYKPLSLQEAVILTASVYQIFFDKDVPVIRMGLQPTEELSRTARVLAGPYHPSFGHLVLSELLYAQTVGTINKRDTGTGETLTITVNPRSSSTIRGLNNTNIRRFKETFGFNAVRIVEDARLLRQQTICEVS